MSNDTVASLAAPAPVPDPLTELLRSGARRLIEAAVRAELEEHLSSFGHEKLSETQAFHCPLKRGNSNKTGQFYLLPTMRSEPVAGRRFQREVSL